MLKRLDLRGFAGDLPARLPAPTTGGSEPVEAVTEIVDAVRRGGDSALLALTERFDGVRLTSVVVDHDEVSDALASIDADLRDALGVAATRLEAFHRHQLTTTASPTTFDDGLGVVVETEYRAVHAAACYVPGGLAVYPSTVLHTVIPAKVAGVERVVVCVPPGHDGHVPAVTLAACAIAGADEVVSVGGAQAIAAVAFGTETISPVDAIVGPGNIYVALAKRMVAEHVGVPSAFAGPSEVVVVADRTAPIDLVAIDLLVQAEHGPLGLAWCVTWDEAVADAITDEVASQAAAAPRHREIQATLTDNGYVVLCDSAEQAAQVVDAVAPEHLEVMTADDAGFVAGIRNAGAVFCGPATPASLGDYLAGPSHVLPTHRSARYGQALGVRDFLKEMHVVSASPAAMATLAPSVSRIALAEGLVCHAESASRRTAP